MTDLSLTLPNLLFILAASFGQGFGLWLSVNQYLEPRFHRFVALIGYTFIDLITVFTFNNTPLSIRSFSTPTLFFLATLFLYRGTVVKKALVIAFIYFIIDFLELLLLACSAIFNISFHYFTDNRIVLFFVGVILLNVLLALFSFLFGHLMPVRILSVPQGKGSLIVTVLSLLTSVSCLGAITFLTISENGLLAGTALCVGIMLLISGVLILLWIFRRVELISQKESEQVLLQKEWEISVKSDAQAEKYRCEVESLGNRMCGILDEITASIRQQKSTEAVACIDRNISEVQKIKRPQNLQNPIADYFLTELKERCEPENIKLSADVELPESVGIDDLDFCTVLSNILDNAVKACKDVNGKRYIKLTIHKNDNILFIGCENSKPPVLQPGGLKCKNGHFGLMNIRETVNQYGGDVEISDEPERFFVQILLYC